MTIFKINYYAHLILQSKYSFIIKLLIFFCIYLSFYFPSISYCMTGENEFLEGLTVLETDPEFQRRNAVRVEEILKRVAEKTENRQRIFVGECKGVELVPDTTSETSNTQNMPSMAEAKEEESKNRLDTELRSKLLTSKFSKKYHDEHK